MSPVFPTVGAHPLTGVAKLPNATVIYPGERWSNRIAAGPIVPGEAVVPAAVGGKLAVRRAVAADEVTQMAIATRVVEPPDSNSGSLYGEALGPNEIKNLQIKTGEYVLAHYSGAFALTLVVPRAWAPGELVGWNETGARPTGKAGAGAWDVAGGAGVNDPLFEVMEFRPFNAGGTEGILNVRSLRGQF
jgi:hypothetical protein